MIVRIAIDCSNELMKDDLLSELDKMLEGVSAKVLRQIGRKHDIHHKREGEEEIDILRDSNGEQVGVIDVIDELLA